MTIDVHLPDMISKDLLSEHPRNSNKQSRHEFKELRKSIRENGFDESLIVVSRDDGNDGYWIISGNHRFRAAVAEGMDELPCVIRDDWDEVEQQVELVRRNYVRGEIDKKAFTLAVDSLIEEAALPISDIKDLMGFEDADQFLAMYQQQEQQELAAATESIQKQSAPQVKMIDDLGLILSAIFEEHGDTVPNSFIVFPAGGKKHLFVAATPTLVRVLGEVAEYCMTKHLDINIVLGGLLAIGKSHAKWATPEITANEIADSGTEQGSDEF